MESKGLSTSASILIGAILISISILLSSGVIKINNLGSSAPSAGGQPTAATPAPQAPPAPSGPVKVSVSDNPVLGDKNAKVTLIEFSDYECPFCKRHFDQVYPQLKKDYLDTGKVKLVYRNYPLPFHDPMATYEAKAALCAREQGGDATYFKIHDEIFKQTTSNGNGLTKDKVKQIAASLGLNADVLSACADGTKYDAKIKSDIADGSVVGVNGTPSFFIGKSDPSGTINGTIIVGAQPYSAFQTAIDPLLK